MPKYHVKFFKKVKRYIYILATLIQGTKQNNIFSTPDNMGNAHLHGINHMHCRLRGEAQSFHHFSSLVMSLKMRRFLFFM